MNIFRKYTKMSLKENRSRTIITIIGIALSMALMTAVIQGANSGQQFFIRNEIRSAGAFEGSFYDLTEDQAEQVRNWKKVKDTVTWKEVGWADIGSKNDYKPYLLIESVDSDFTDLVSIQMLEGRMPENENEIMLPAHLEQNGGVYHKIGDTLTLSVGTRFSDGTRGTECDPFFEGSEELTDCTERTYTVTGFFERLNNCVEEISCPGYIALTTGPAEGNSRVFFTLKNPVSFYSIMNTNPFTKRWTVHSDLLRFSGFLGSGNVRTMLYGMVAILLFLISFGSIALICNSFSISISERIRQFGILKSLGATRKQIKRTVYYEAFLLCVFAVPLGVMLGLLGIGITLYLLNGSFSRIFEVTDVKMYLVISPFGLLISVLLCVFTTLISAGIPAKKAIRVSPMESIRQTNSVKIRAKEVRTSRITEKLFGAEGMLASKNFKRNRKRYRITIFSLAVSLILFISASSFCAYLKASMGGMLSGSIRKDDISYMQQDVSVEHAEHTLQILSEAEGVTEAYYYQACYQTMFVPQGNLSKNYIRYAEKYQLPRALDGYEESVQVLFVNDEAYSKICETAGIPEETEAFVPGGILRNQITKMVKSEKWVKTDLIRTDRYPVSFMKRDESGKLYELKVRAVIPEDLEIPGDPGYAIVLYPMSQRDSVLEYLNLPLDVLTSTRFGFMAPSHQKVSNEMTAILQEHEMTAMFLYDMAGNQESMKSMLLVINVFSYGFIILISLIAMANVFNTISTNIALRRREFGMLKSMGMNRKQIRKMMDYECLIYGFRSLLFGMPAAIALTYLIYRVGDIAMETAFFVPWYSILIAVLCVFLVVFAAMGYSVRKLNRENLIDALRTEGV